MNENQPLWRASQGALAASAWLNQRTTADGRQVEHVAIRIERRYKAADGAWKSTNAYTTADLMALRHFLGRVIDTALAHDRTREDAPPEQGR